jgi:DNA-binding SARP family transcriptional activator
VGLDPDHGCTSPVLHRGEALTSDRLIHHLWADQPPATAGKTLQVYVSHLRKALGRELLVTAGGGYRLDVAPEQVDAELPGTCRRRAALARGRRCHGGARAWSER